MSNMAKSRSWTFPVHPSAAAGVAPVAFADCQTLLLPFLCLTFLYTVGKEAVSPREEDSGAGGGDAAEEEEVGDVASVVQWFVLEAQWSVLEVHCGVLDAQCDVTEVHCSFLEAQYIE